MSFLETLDPQEQAVVQRYFGPIRFKQGDRIMRQGEPGDGCYLIDEGEVRLELIDVETDSDNVLGYVGPGMFLGEFSLLDGAPRSACAYAHTDVAARWFSRDAFDELGERYPRIGLAISNALGRNLTAKLRYWNDRIAEYLFAEDIDAETNEMVARAVVAQRELVGWSEERIDALLGDIAEAVAGQAEELARACVEETGIGNVEDKVIKIGYGGRSIYQSLVGRPAAGTLHVDPQRLVTEIAAPMGVVLGIIPVTHPVATITFKTLICLKARNALIYSCHHNAMRVGNRTGDIVQGVLRRHGAPADLVQWVRERTSRRKTTMLMKHPDVSLILATGGPSLVKAAYSSGKPAIGVGAGNAPTWVCADADLPAVAQMIVASKSFDNGVICGSENNLLVDAAVYRPFAQALEAHGAAVLTAEEKERFVAQAFDEHGHLARAFIGQSAPAIAGRLDIVRPYPFRLLVVPAGLDDLDGPLGREKMAPIVSLLAVDGEEEGLRLCKHILNNEGRGHTAAIHTHNQALIARFGQEVEVSRILVNLPATQGCAGLASGLVPSFTLGCGTFGGNSTTDNVTYSHLLNIKRVAEG